MKLAVILEFGSVERSAELASAEDLESACNEWGMIVRTSERPPRRAQDSFDFIYDANDKIKTYRRRGEFCLNESELLEAVNADQHCERLALLTVRAEWYTSSILGFALVRRTWMNNLFIDFLATHPAEKIKAEVGGIGSQLIFGAAKFAEAISAHQLIFETTNSSIGFYKRVFKLKTDKNIVQIRTSVALKALVEYLEN